MKKLNLFFVIVMLCASTPSWDAESGSSLIECVLLHQRKGNDLYSQGCFAGAKEEFEKVKSCLIEVNKNRKFDSKIMAINAAIEDVKDKQSAKG